MKTIKYIKKIIAGALLLTVSVNSYAQNRIPQGIHVGLVYPMSTHGTHAPLDTNFLSLHAIAGVSAAERGVAVSGFATVIKHDITGIAVSGFANIVRQKSQGVLVSGFANIYRDAVGFQISGFANIASENVDGGQFAGFLNVAKKFTGAQVAGFSNIARDVDGSQFSGFYNVGREITGSQFAGFSNIAGQSVNGSQFSGFINKAENVKGSQFAGFINLAKKVKGAQIAGFINIADSSDCPIGFLNLIKHGEKSIGVSIDETQTTLLSFRSGGKSMYGILGLGYNFENTKQIYALEVGLGAHFFPSAHFRMKTELAAINLEDFRRGNYFKGSLSVLPTIKIGKRLEISGGPTLNYVSTTTTEGRNLSDHYIKTWLNNRNHFQGAYIGYLGVLSFKL